MDWSQALRFDGSIIIGELIISFAVMIIIIALAFVIYFRFRNLAPDKPQKGFNLYETSFLTFWNYLYNFIVAFINRLDFW